MNQECSFYDLPPAGIVVEVLRAREDSTNGGITTKHDRVILTGEGIPQVVDASDEVPALKLVRPYGSGAYHVHAEPVERPAPGSVGWMFGGNFVYSSDRAFPSCLPIPVHDRQETAAEYQQSSI